MGNLTNMVQRIANKVLMARQDGKLLAAYAEFFKQGKDILAILGKMHALDKKYDRLTGYKGKGTPEELSKLILEFNGWRAASRKLTQTTIGKYDAAVGGAALHTLHRTVQQAEAKAEKALAQDHPLDPTKPMAAGLDLRFATERVHTYYDYLASVVDVLADLTGKKPLPSNPFQLRLASQPANVLDGLDRRQAMNVANKVIQSAKLSGFFDDSYWAPVQRIWAALTKAGIDWEMEKNWYDKDLQGNPSSKTWTFRINWKDKAGRPQVGHGRVVASGGGSADDPLDRYDVTAYVS